MALTLASEFFSICRLFLWIHFPNYQFGDMSFLHSSATHRVGAGLAARVLLALPLMFALAAVPLAAQESRLSVGNDGVVKVRSYACRREQQAKTVEGLRRAHGDHPDFRVTADAVRNRLYIVAPLSIHAEIKQRLNEIVDPADDRGNQPRVLQSNPDVRFRSTTDRAPQSRPLAATQTRFIMVSADVNALRQQLKAALGPRLRAVEDSVRNEYTLSARGRRVAELEFDARRGGVLVTASSDIIPQLELLLKTLGSSREGQQRTAIMSIQRSDPIKLRRAIRAYRGSTTNPDGSSRHMADDGGLALVNFVLQVPDEETQEEGVAEPQPEAGGDAPVGGLDVDVEVQTLPDLDVIILRGRDRDVERLTEIIQELERLSELTQPRIQVYQLRHAQGEAIAEIIDTVNEDLTGRRQGRVSVTPLVKPNALLLIGWGEAVQAMLELIGKLDTPVPANTQFDVFRLRHAPADSVTTAITDFFDAREGLGPKVFTLADIRSNSVIAYAAPRDMEEIRRLVESLDIPTSEAVNQAKVIAVQNAIAADLATTLLEAIQGADGTDAAAPSAILELLTLDEGRQQMVRSGILTNIRITANPRNNTLIVSGPSESLPLVEELIRQLDTPGAVSQIKVFRIVNGDAGSLVQMLRSLLPSQSGAGTGPQLPSAKGETSLAPLRFSVDTRTNSIIAAGSEGDLTIIEALLLRLDERDFAERRNEVYRLKNAPALDVAAAINEFLRSERLVQQAVPGGPVLEQIEREVVVVPEPVRNFLIISATARYFEAIKEIVVSLDEQPPQVLIQAVIAEVALNNTDEFGVEMGIQDSVLFDRSLLSELITTIATGQQSTADGIITVTEEIIQSANIDPGFDFNNRPLGNSGSTQSVASRGTVGSQALSHFAIDRVNDELGFGGLVLSASSDSVSILIRALQESRRLEVLSRPQVRTLDNQSAFIQVGQRVPRITASNITEGGLQTNTVELENVGLILGVTPRISPDGMVVMEVDAEKSQLGPEEEGIPITVSVDGSVIRSPRIDTRTAQATVSAASGETIILGGLITNRKESVARQVPYLSRIPLLGDVFRYDREEKQRTELLIILTPHVIRTPADAQRLKQIETARMSWCAADVYQIHGDIGVAPDVDMYFDNGTEVIYPDLNPRGEPMDPPEPAPLTPNPAGDAGQVDLQDASVSPVSASSLTRSSDSGRKKEKPKRPSLLSAVRRLPGSKWILPRKGDHE